MNLIARTARSLYSRRPSGVQSERKTAVRTGESVLVYELNESWRLLRESLHLTESQNFFWEFCMESQNVELPLSGNRLFLFCQLESNFNKDFIKYN